MLIINTLIRETQIHSYSKNAVAKREIRDKKFQKLHSKGEGKSIRKTCLMVYYRAKKLHEQILAEQGLDPINTYPLGSVNSGYDCRNNLYSIDITYHK